MSVHSDALSSLASDYAKGMTSIRGRRVQRLLKREFAGARYVWAVQVGSGTQAVFGLSPSGAAFCVTDGRGPHASVVKWLHGAAQAIDIRVDLLKDSLPVLSTQSRPLPCLAREALLRITDDSLSPEARALVAMAIRALAPSAPHAPACRGVDASGPASIARATRNVEAECEQVLRSLPMWFGQEDSLLEYVRGTSRLPTFISAEGEAVNGFVTLHQHFPRSFEIVCVAVHAASRGRGIGRALLEQASAWAKAHGGEFLQVKTIAASHPSPEYAQTRAFYESVGFAPLEVFPTLWTPRHPCLQLMKHLPDVS